MSALCLACGWLWPPVAGCVINIRAAALDELNLENFSEEMQLM